MRQDIETLEPRRMLSAVAAHVVGSTLKITGTPHNDSIVVSLKGHTLTVNANKIARTFPAKGVKLIDLRGGGGKNKLQVTAPIAYKLNGGKTVTPFAASLTHLQAAPERSRLQASSRSARLTQLAAGTDRRILTTANASNSSASFLAPISGSYSFAIPHSDDGGAIWAAPNSTDTNSSATLAIAWFPSAPNLTFSNVSDLECQWADPAKWAGVPNTSGFATMPNIEVGFLPAPGQVPQFTLDGDESSYLDHPLSFTVTLDPAAAISPGTYPLIRFAAASFMPADISGVQFESDTVTAQYTCTLALNTANRTIDLVIAYAPAADPTAADEPTAQPLATDQPI